MTSILSQLDRQAAIDTLKRTLDVMDRRMTLATVLPVREAWRTAEDFLGDDTDLTEFFTAHEIQLISSALNFDPALQG